MADEKTMQVSCPNCRAWLLSGLSKEAFIKIKCKECGSMISISLDRTKILIEMAENKTAPPSAAAITMSRDPHET